MNIVKKEGLNRRGRVEWIDTDIDRVMGEWELDNYKSLVSETERCIGRDCTVKELRILCWLAGSDDHTIETVKGLIIAAFQNGKGELTP